MNLGRASRMLAVAVLAASLMAPSYAVASPRASVSRFAVPQVSAQQALAATAISPAAPRSSQRAAKRRPLALVYRGPASCSGCSEAAAKLIKSARRKFRVAYIGPKERRKLTATNLRKAALYVQPGGDTSVAKADRLLGAKAKKAITRYVRAGGRYLGICQGAYLAGSMPGMGLLRPANTDQYIKTKGAATKSVRDTVIPVQWGTKRYPMYFQDGPYFTTGSARGVEVLARYTNGKIAALTKKVGSGRVAVIGPHPEAPRVWYQAIGQADKSKRGRNLGKRLINSVMTRP